jgi:rhodanese-related sulfurtransferase/molybdopterin-guanine dinucleotide biosynthesis protein A
MVQTSGAVLVGGQSSRFGRSKALARVDGITMAEHVAAVLEDAGCRPVVFVGGAADEIVGLAHTGRVHLRDRWPAEGPLGGVLTALMGLGAEVVVAACDLVDLSVASVRSVMVDDDSDITIAVASGERRALARWRMTGRDELLDHFARGDRSLVGAHLDTGSLRVGEASVDALEVIDYNRPDALRAAGRLTDDGTQTVAADHGGPPAQAARVSAMVPQIDIEALAALLEQNVIRLVDVREADEFAAGHIAGADSIPLSELQDRVDELRGDRPLYLICGVGARSQMACEFAVSVGVDAINVDGGTSGWIQSGRPVVVGDS